MRINALDYHQATGTLIYQGVAASDAQFHLYATDGYTGETRDLGTRASYGVVYHGGAGVYDNAYWHVATSATGGQNTLFRTNITGTDFNSLTLATTPITVAAHFADTLSYSTVNDFDINDNGILMISGSARSFGTSGTSAIRQVATYDITTGIFTEDCALN